MVAVYQNFSLTFPNCIQWNHTEPLKKMTYVVAATWMDLESVILSEVSATEKKRNRLISLICGICKEIIQMNLQNRNRLTDFENELMVAEGKDGKRG